MRVSESLNIESGDEINPDEEVEEDAYISVRRSKVDQMNMEFFLDLRRKYEEKLKIKL